MSRSHTVGITATPARRMRVCKAQHRRTRQCQSSGVTLRTLFAAVNHTRMYAAVQTQPAPAIPKACLACNAQQTCIIWWWMR
jgi:hypothetical protein